MKNKVVYYHRTKEEELQRVFYVGCGNEERAYDFRKGTRSKEWNKIHNEFDTEVVIYDSNLSEEEAYKMEIELIAFFGRQCKGGFLVNKSIGGNGVTLSETQIKEIRHQFKFYDYRGMVKALAKKYKVSQTTISQIKRNVRWKHIEWNTILKKD